MHTEKGFCVFKKYQNVLKEYPLHRNTSDANAMHAEKGFYVLKNVQKRTQGVSIAQKCISG